MFDYLFAQPSFLSGAARVIDLGGTFDDYNRSRTPDAADMRAMYADWRAVGEGIFRAAEDLKKAPAQDVPMQKTLL